MTRFVLLLLAAVPLAAQHPVAILPFGPTDQTPVTVRFTHPCANDHNSTATVAREGAVIRITIRQISSCPSPPIFYPYDVPIGVLPPGQYRVEILEHGAVFAARSFVVRGTASELRPFAIPTDPRGLTVSVERLPSPRPQCKEPCTSLRIGNTLVATNYYGFVAPPQPPGFADLSYTAADGSTYVVPRVLFYYDRSAAPDLSLFERVLFPVLFRSGGVGGSHWVSEAVVSNPNPWTIDAYNDIQRIVCITFPCGERFAPESRVAFDGEGFPQGVALLVPRGEADDMAFSLRVRDVSREAEGFGTTIPVVRESDMFSDTTITLLDVPVDARYRTKIRVYAFPDPYPDDPWVGLGTGVFIKYAPGNATTHLYAKLVRNCSSGSDCALQPHYAEFDVVPDPAKGNRADVYVTLPAGAPGWAFASVTNNATQQVTVVTPDGKGGRPGGGSFQ